MGRRRVMALTARSKRSLHITVTSVRVEASMRKRQRPYSKIKTARSLGTAPVVIGLIGLLGITLSSCSGGNSSKVEANSGTSLTVGVTKVTKKTLARQITLSSELVPFQEIDVYAKESGYVRKLDVDYGSHVKAGQVMATLEIPELEAQLQEDQAEIKNAMNQVVRADH